MPFISHVCIDRDPFHPDCLIYQFHIQHNECKEVELQNYCEFQVAVYSSFQPSPIRVFKTSSIYGELKNLNLFEDYHFVAEVKRTDGKNVKKKMLQGLLKKNISLGKYLCNTF